MASVPFGADGWEYLTPAEQEVLARIERDVSSSDPRLADALSAVVRPVPAWLVGVARAALLLMVPVLLLPFPVWSSIVLLTSVILVCRLLRHPLRG